MDDEKQTDDIQENEHDPIMVTIGGTSFDMKISVGVMRRLRKLDPPIDITRLVDERDPDGGLWVRMRDDPAIVVDIVHEVVKGQPGAVEDPEAFAELIGGDDLESLYQATLRAIVLFTPSPKNRKALTKIIQRIDIVEGQLLDKAIQEIDDGVVDRAIHKALEESKEQSTSGSTRSRDKPGSTQRGTRSES